MEHIIESRCLSENTYISMANGSITKIRDIQIGNLITSTKGVAQVSNIWRGHEEEILELKTNNKTLTLTKDHPVLLNDGTWVRAGNIKEGNIVQTRDGNEEVISTTILNYDSLVYNLDITQSHHYHRGDEGVAFFAEGIAVGDFRTQNQRLKSD